MKKLNISRLTIQIVSIALSIYGLDIAPVWAIIILTITFGAYDCGWVCAFGSIQEFIRKFGKKVIKKTISIPRKIDRYLLYIRYITFFVSLGYIIELLDGRRTLSAIVSGKDVNLPFIIIMLSFLLISLFIDRPFCKYICPKGATYGLFGMARLFMINRNKENCINCKLCTKNCQMGIDVANNDRIAEPHCISCGLCIESCPKKGALYLKIRQFNKPTNLVLFIMGIYAGYRMIMNALQ